MPRVWYGGGTLSSGTGEPINDVTGQWSPVGCSVRMGATDSGHDTGLLVTNRVGGVVDRIYVRVNANTWASGGSWLLRRRNHNGGSPTFENTTIVVNDGATGVFSDLTSTFTITDGNDYEWEWTRTGGGSGSMSVSSISYALTPSGGGSAFQWNCAEKTGPANNATRHLTPFGDNGGSTEINSNRAKMRVAGNITHFGVRVFSNLRTTNTVFQLQKTGVDIGSGVTFGSLATGFVEDAGFGTPVAMAVDDYLSVRVTTLAGTELLEYTCVTTTIVPTDNEFQCGVGSGGGIVINAGTTRYIHPLGECVNVATVDGNTKMTAPFTMGLDRFRGYIRSNSLTGGETATLNIRVNGVTQRTIVWTAPASGESTPSDSSQLVVSEGDELDYSFVCTGGSGSAQLMNVVFRAVDLEVLPEPGAIVFNLQLG